MNARIFIDLDAILPVVDGVWHRVELVQFPEPGQGLTMLCGVAAAAEFAPLGERRAGGPPVECWDCDLLYRRRHHIAVLPTHPALRH